MSTTYSSERGEGPSVLVAVGARVEPEEIVYPADPVAQKHGAAVAVETSVPDEAYRQFEHRWRGYEEGWLPE